MICDWAERVLNGLSLRRKAAQLLMPRIGGEFPAAAAATMDRALHQVEDLGVGGLIVSAGAPLDIAVKLNMLQRRAAVALLVAADMEHGPGQVLAGGTVLPYGFENGGATRFPPLMALGATGDERYAYELGRVTALEARAAGIHAVFAPVADVNSNPANPIINTRSYGADPALVGGMAAAHVRGLQENGVLAVAKHFPGHGDTSTDSHRRLPEIRASFERVDEIDLPPFRAVIDADTAAIMSAHIAFPALTGDSVPATLNPRLLSGLLRNDLGFDGLIFTDALDMGAIADGYGAREAAVLALRAGADVLLQPDADDVDGVVDAIVAAVERGVIDAARLDASVLRILHAKCALGLHERAQVDIEQLPVRIGAAAHLAAARNAAAHSLTRVRDRGALLPLRGRVAVLLYANHADPFAGRAFLEALERHGVAIESVRLAADAAPATMARAEAIAVRADVVVFAAFLNVSALTGPLALPDDIARAVNHIAREHHVVAVSFGSPWIFQQLGECGTCVAAWAPWEPMQSAAAAALTSGAPLTGTLPVPLEGGVGAGAVS